MTKERIKSLWVVANVGKGLEWRLVEELLTEVGRLQQVEKDAAKALKAALKGRK